MNDSSLEGNMTDDNGTRICIQPTQEEMEFYSEFSWWLEGFGQTVLGYIYNIYKIGLENFEILRNYRADFAFFGLIRTVQSVFRSWSNFWSCNLGHLKNRVLAPFTPNFKSKEIFFSNSAKLQHIFKINSNKHGIRWTFVLWNWRWKITLKLDVLQANGY